MCTRAIWARTFQAVCRKKSRDTKRSPGAEQRAGCLRSPPEPAKFLLCRDRAQGTPPPAAPRPAATSGGSQGPGWTRLCAGCGSRAVSPSSTGRLATCLQLGGKTPPPVKGEEKRGPRRGSGSQVLLPNQLQFPPPPSRDLLEQFLPPGVGSRSVTAAPGTSVPKPAELGTRRAAPPRLPLTHPIPPPAPTHP